MNNNQALTNSTKINFRSCKKYLYDIFKTLLYISPILAALLFIRTILINANTDKFIKIYNSPIKMWFIMLVMFTFTTLLCAFIFRKVNNNSNLKKIEQMPLQNKNIFFLAGIIIVIFIMIIIYGNLFFVFDCRDNFGNNSNNLIWHKFPRFVVTFCFLIVLIVEFCVWKICSATNSKKMKQILVYSIYAICIISFLSYFFQQNFFGDANHQNAYIQSIFNVWFDTPYDKTTTGIYGHYGLFFKLPMLLFGHGITQIAALISFFGLIGIVSMFYVFENNIKSTGIRILAAMSITFFLSTMILTPYWQTIPHRIIFSSVILAYCTWVSKKHIFTIKYQIIGYFLCSLAILWNTETGLICTFAFAAYICINLWRNTKCFCKKAFITYLEQIVGIVLALLGAIFTVNLYNLLCGGHLIFRAFFYPLFNKLYMKDVLFYPLVWENNSWVHCLILFLICLIVALNSTVLYNKKDEDNINNSISLLGLNAILGLGQFTYYVNRAAYINLSIVLFNAVFCIAYIADQGLTKLYKKERRTIKDGMRFGVTIGFICILSGLSLNCINLPEVINKRVVLPCYDLSVISTLAKETKLKIPRDTYAFGIYTVPLYGHLDWDPGYHKCDVADVVVDGCVIELDKEASDVIIKEVFSQPTLLVSKDVFKLMEKHPEYKMKDTIEFIDSEVYYAYYVKNK